MIVAEKYYAPYQVADLLSVSTKTVLRRLKDGEFGDKVVNVGNADKPLYRIPASAVNAFAERHQVVTEEPGITARSEQDLRRKLGKAA
jgi:hypothetical protein